VEPKTDEMSFLGSTVITPYPFHLPKASIFTFKIIFMYIQKTAFLRLLLILVSGFLGASIAIAQPYLPFKDSTFAGNGVVFLQDNFQFIPHEQKVMSDGKILIAGYGRGQSTATAVDGIIYRLNEDGNRDLTFGPNGFKKIDIDGTFDAIEAVDETSDHKILILLTSFDRTILVRLLPNGSYDTDFGNDGILQTEAANTEYPYDMHIQADQKIVVCGYERVLNNLNKGYVRRFNSDGSIDPGFGTNGYVSCVIDATKNLELNSFVFQPDEKIVATGNYSTGSTSGFPVFRLNTDGSFDNTFSGDGKFLKVMGNTTRSASAWCIAVKPDGKIIVGGNAPTTSESAMTVVQVKPDGITDTNFGSFGAAKVVVSWFNEVNAMVVQPDGKIVLGGYCFASDTTTYFLMTRLNANGVQDITFGPSNGYFATLYSTDGYNIDIITRMSLLPTGKMLVLGWTNYSINLALNQPAYASVIRYLTGILVDTYEPNPVFQSALVYPSPVRNELVTLSYELDQTREISLSLYDASGREIAILINGEVRSTGLQQEQFYLPAGLAAGNYFLELTTDEGQKALQIVKY
jgi:uncharacterized delta-60 repeat protein